MILLSHKDIPYYRKTEMIIRNKDLRECEKNIIFAPAKRRNKFLQLRKDARVTEWGGLEIRCTACPYRGFESLSFRKAQLRVIFNCAFLFQKHRVQLFFANRPNPNLDKI